MGIPAFIHMTMLQLKPASVTMLKCIASQNYLMGAGVGVSHPSPQAYHDPVSMGIDTHSKKMHIPSCVCSVGIPEPSLPQDHVIFLINSRCDVLW